MAINRAQLAKELEPGLNALFGMEYNRYDNEHAEIFDQETSDRAFEEEVMIVGFGNAPVKPEGSGVSFDNTNEGFTARYEHETVALAFALTEEAVEDNLYDRLGSRYTKALARSMANTKQIKAASILNNAFSASFVGGDGQPLVSTAHPLSSGASGSNRAATFADLNETSLEDALIRISTQTDDRGLAIALQGQKLVVPPQLQFVADRLLNSPGRVGTSDNDINSINNQGMLPDGYVVNHYLNDPDAYFIKTDVPDGFKHFVRSPMATSLEGDFDTGNMRYKARERYSFGFSNWRCVDASQGA
ncbi:Mu-like prophage major head subunit gpT family protein [Gammaproteobacteria bacterium]|nr:Mu-like prophage major head subunit gpT family protein [Gammaproteobacteria bacterium]